MNMNAEISKRNQQSKTEFQINNTVIYKIFRLRLRNHLFRQRLHRIEYYKKECTDVSWRFLLRPLGVAITKTTSWNAKIYIYIKPESKV